MKLRTAIALLVLAAASGSASDAWADTTECTEINGPGTLTQQGLYCLKKPLVFSFYQGPALTIAANNVTIDCNGYSISQVADSPTNTVGIRAQNRNNAVVRNCTLEGFRNAIQLSGDGIVVEDNMLRGNSNYGIEVVGDNGLIRRNQVIDTGGVAGTWYPEAIRLTGTGDVLDNVVAGVTALSGTNHTVWGIRITNSNGGQVARNRVHGLAPDGSGQAAGVQVGESANVLLLENTVLNAGASGGRALGCANPGLAMATGNHLVGWPVAIHNCGVSQNVIKP